MLLVFKLHRDLFKKIKKIHASSPLLGSSSIAHRESAKQQTSPFFVMSVYKQLFRRIIFANEKYFKLVFSYGCSHRIFAGNKTLATMPNLWVGHSSRLASSQSALQGEEKQLSEYRFVFPEFLPSPQFRHRVRERLEREDMLRRRSALHIPEFYVGSVLAVSASDPHAPGGRSSRFVGLCIARSHEGLRATFTLRNVVDRQGVEVLYELYNPLLLHVEVLRLERRLDEELYYLRDAPPHHSTFPFDMEPEFVAEGQPPRLNTTKVQLNPPPWHAKWEQRGLQGAELGGEVPPERARAARRNATPWERFDLMKEYRRCIPEEEQSAIWRQVDEATVQLPKRRQTWKRTLKKAPSKSA